MNCFPLLRKTAYLIFALAIVSIAVFQTAFAKEPVFSTDVKVSTSMSANPLNFSGTIVTGLPWAMGETWNFTQNFHGGQNALDFQTRTGAPGRVLAADAGTVIMAYQTCTKIQRADGLVLGYQHLEPADISRLSIGRQISKGDYLGMTTGRWTNGSTGCGGTSDGNLVHFWAEGPNFQVGSIVGGYTIDGICGTQPALNKPGQKICPVSPITYVAENIPPAGYTYCANEGGRCNFGGNAANVVYGARNSFTNPRTFIDGVDCNNSVFGDPLSGIDKACYYKPTYYLRIRDRIYWDTVYTGNASPTTDEKWTFYLNEPNDFKITATRTSGDIMMEVGLQDASGNTIIVEGGDGMAALNSVQPAGNYSVIVIASYGSGSYNLTISRNLIPTYPGGGYTKCAEENGRCNFSGSGNVVYGALNSFTAARSFTGGVDCNNGVFGDPINSVTKVCYFKPAPVIRDRDRIYWDTVYSGSVDEITSEKWTFYFGEENDFTITATPNSSNLDLGLALFNGNGDVVVAMGGDGVLELNETQPAGNYSVLVSSGSGSGSYNLSIKNTTPLYSISGRVTGDSGAGIPGVNVSTNAGRTATTDCLGNYKFDSIRAGTYNLSSSKNGYMISPSSINSVVVPQNMSLPEFKAYEFTTGYFSITGRVVDYGKGLSSVCLSDNYGAVASTDSNGDYSFPVQMGWSRTITPIKEGFIFAPVNKYYGALYVTPPSQIFDVYYPHNPLILIPGVMGSKLNNNYGEVWPNALALKLSPGDEFLRALKLNNLGNGPYIPYDDPESESMYSSVRVGDIIRSEYGKDFYESTIKYLTEQGYTENVDLVLCPYDWRKSIPEIALGSVSDPALKDNNLEKCITDALAKNPGKTKVDILAHSMGGLIARYYISMGHPEKIDHLVSLGTPYLGAPMIAQALIDKKCMLEDGGSCLSNPDMIKELAINFPSIYEIAPGEDFFTVYGGYIMPLDRVGEFLLQDKSDELLGVENSFLVSKARDYTRNAGGWSNGSTSNVKLMMIVGSGISTTEYLSQIEYLSEVTYIAGNGNGDGSVPLYSANMGQGLSVNKNLSADVKETCHFKKTHGDLPKDVSTGGVMELAVTYFETSKTTSESNDKDLCKHEIIDLDHAQTAGQLIGQSINPLRLNGRYLTFVGDGDLEVIDEFGNRIGKIDEGGAYEVNVPDASYFQLSHSVSVFLPDDRTYRILINGKEQFENMVNIQKYVNDIVEQTTVYDPMIMGANSTATLDFDPAGLAENFKVDHDGNGTVDGLVEVAAVLDQLQSLDDTAPETTINITGTPAANDWYSGEITVSILAEDNPGGVGVESVGYSLDGGTTILEYSAPFKIDAALHHQILARSIDLAGNRSWRLAAACYELTTTHTGSGTDPAISPANSTDCASGQYHAGELVTLTAAPASGWKVGDWSGTDNNSSTSSTNTSTMPDANYQVGVAYVNISPSVVSVVRATPSPTALSNVNFTVTFSEPVTGVDVADFTLTTSGIFGAFVSNVSGTSSVYTVTVNAGIGNGTLRLDVLNNNSIVDSVSNPLSASFSAGEVYTVTRSVVEIPRTLTFLSNGPADGWILESGENSSTGGTVDKIANTLIVGDEQNDRQYRSILSFNTLNLPQDIIITGAQLRLQRQSLVGTDPVTTHGALLVELRDSTFGGNLALVPEDFDAPASPGAAVGQLTPGASAWYTYDFSIGNLNYITKVGYTQIRLRFTLDDNDDLNADYIKFFSGDAVDEAVQPQLVISYLPAFRVTSITRTSINPTSASNVDFAVTLSESATGVNKDDFVLATTGISGATVMSVSGSGSTYTVTVRTGNGNGTLRLDVADNNTILNSALEPLGGPAMNDGHFRTGEVYTVTKSASGGAAIGVFRPSNGLLYLKNQNTSGFADVAINYGTAGDYPIAGDWDGDGTATIGIYRNGSFYLRNSNTLGFADLVIPFGTPGDQPVVGDWNGDGVDTIGVYSNGHFLLRNSNTAGPADMSFYLGNPGDVGIAGDWNGDCSDTTGVFRPSNGIIFLKNLNTSGFADININYGLSGDMPITGDWDNDGIDSIGVYRNAQFYLRNSNTIGFADIVFALGNLGDMPISGNWDGLP